MASYSAIGDLENLHLSEINGECTRKSSNQKVSSEKDGPENEETLFDREEARETALRDELQNIQHINGVIEGLLDSLDRAKGNMQARSHGSHLPMFEVLTMRRPSPIQSTRLRPFSIRGHVFSHRQSITNG